MPGLFRPGEPAAAAALLGLPLDVFARGYLATAKTHRGTQAVLPRIIGTPAGASYGTYDSGPCIFLEAGRCKIYAARPYECAHGNPCDGNQDAYWEARDETARLWGQA
jgi:Fe-S-cluster containining protein